jgi:hypothetical protein
MRFPLGASCKLLNMCIAQHQSLLPPTLGAEDDVVALAAAAA